MKVCPVCNETFADDMKFCDLDGTRLARQAEATGAPAHHRTWSLLGIGLLVGALILSAVSVFMIPRSRALPTASSSPAPANSAAGKPADSTGTPSAGDNASAPASDQPEIVIAEAPPADAGAKKKDRVKPATENETAPALNPKAAAQTDEEADKPAPAPAPKKPEPAPAPKAASETREPETAPKPAAAPDSRRDPKHPKDAAKDADKKKADDKDKKKGGFFKVFKKIFGKD
jgi:outer membrane biosynthesis protein TonB